MIPENMCVKQAISVYINIDKYVKLKLLINIFHPIFRYGEDITKATIQYSGKGGVYLDSLQPTSLARIQEMENATGHQVGIASTPISEAPKFTSQLIDITHLKEGQSAHFEARVTPVNDPNLVVSFCFYS